MATFVDLDRSFIPLCEGQDPPFQVGREAGRQYYGWLGWADLLSRPRCVVLAEAGAGKTEEICATSARLTAEGRFAFLLRVEDLAECEPVSCLSPDMAIQYREWEASPDIAHFFVDSIDEARLTGKRLRTALRNLAKGLGERLPRARVLLTCRASDWQWETDLAEIRRLLPHVLTPPDEEDALTPNEKLLAPLFPTDASKSDAADTEVSRCGEILVVLLASLSRSERKPLLENCGVSDTDAFERAIARHGLESFADRPGDVIAMAAYWNVHGRFGTRREMTEFAIGLRLAEEDPHRRKSVAVAPERLRRGAERIAAALTLAKTFAIRAPGSTAIERATMDVIDPYQILSDWATTDVDALLTSGLFAPGTYGRVRFHHRDSQEFLTASWLERIAQDPRGSVSVHRLLCVDRYGQPTVVPSLAPAAAWLAGRRSDIFDELLRRNPIDLIRHGDPRAIPVADKERLLRSYAALHARGDVGDDSLHWSEVAMFAVPELHAGIRAVWSENTRPDFRLDLLRMIRDGVIADAVDLALPVITDRSTPEHLRLVAADAVEICGDPAGLALIAETSRDPNAISTARLATRFASILFPDRIDVDELFDLVERFPSHRFEHSGFNYELPMLWAKCGTDARRRTFMARLAALCLAEPFVTEWHRVSRSHHALTAAARTIAVDAVTRFTRLFDEALIRLLVAAERTDGMTNRDTEEFARLGKLVSAHPLLQRALFWADVDEVRRNTRHGPNAVRIWHLSSGIAALWRFTSDGESWLEEDATNRPLEADRRLAFSILMDLILGDAARNCKVADLRVRIAGHPELLAELEQALALPLEPSAERRKFERQEAAWKKKEAKQKAQDKLSWIDFATRLRARPSILREAGGSREWSVQADLFSVARWLKGKHHDDNKGAAKWASLREAFSNEVAEAYRDGMCLIWRNIEPVRPVRKGNGSSRLYSSELAFDGLLLEASLRADWHARLEDHLVVRAVQHICIGEESVPEFFDQLVLEHSELALPVVEEALIYEWASTNEFGGTLLRHYADASGALAAHIRTPITKLLTSQSPGHEKRFGLAVRCLSRVGLDEPGRELVLSALDLCGSSPWLNTPKLRIALLFLASPDRAVDELIAWIDIARSEGDQLAAYGLLSAFFGDRQDATGMATTLDDVAVDHLEALVLTAYRAVRREDDNVHHGTYEPDLRDHAERARSSILGALLERPGIDAWAAVRRLADQPEMEASRMRFLELARRKADVDAEIAPWDPADVRKFEDQKLAPAKTGAELSDLAGAILEEIRIGLWSADASSRCLLAQAVDEHQVQHWLAEQLQLRSQGRYAVHREPIVADSKEPDIVLTSTQGPAQVAIEIKHGGKGWSGRDLLTALTDQLAGRYLRGAQRRHGFLIITNHAPLRRWENPADSSRLDFPELIEMLNDEAAKLTSCGVIAHAVGLDTTSVKVDTRAG